MTPLTMTALTDAWKAITYIIVRDENGMTHIGFPSESNACKTGSYRSRSPSGTTTARPSNIA